MAYLGKGLNDIATANIVVDTMTGNGSDTTLALSWGAGSKGIGSVNDVSVFYGGCQQRPGQDFTLANGTVTFTTAPMNGVNVVAVSHGDSWQDNVADSTVVTESFADLAITNAKIIGLDSSKLSGAMPAIDGSALTGITETTNSASDPAIDTNGTLGDIWVNTTSGEMFILTDATAGSNAWTNVGAGTGDVQPYIFGGTISGYASGGIPTSGATAINKYSFTSDGNATTHGNLTSRGNMRFMSGVSSGTHGYTVGGGGGTPGTNTDRIDKFAFAGSSVTATDVGNLTSTSFDRTNTSSTETHGYCAGGESTAHANIDKIAYASDGNAVDSGSDLSLGRYGGAGTSSLTHGYVGGGCVNTPTREDRIDRYAFASSGTATDVGNLTERRDSGAAASSSTHGYFAGGYAGASNLNTIDKWAFTSSTNATDVGDLSRASRHLASSSSITHGYAAGGEASVDVIDKWSLISDANGTDVGNLVTGKDGMAGNQY